MSKAGSIATSLVGAMLIAAGPALAEPPGGCPPGLAKKGRCEQYPHWDREDHDWDRDRDRRYEDAREEAYEQGYRDGMRDAWRVGERIPRDRYRVVPDFYEYGWPAPTDGRGYVYADERYYLVEMATGLILDVLTQR